MKLCRIRTSAGIRPAAVDKAGTVRDLSRITPDIGHAQIAPDRLAHLAQVDLSELPVMTGEPAPFLHDFGRIFCIGLNYYDHAAEMDMPIPAHPILFMKACAVTGAHDPIVIPKDAAKTDWEVELGVVIGTGAQHVPKDAALTHVAGYCVANDVSERAFQTEMGGQWVKGKSADSFAPVGPYLVTADAVPDPQDLQLSLRVNDQVMQAGSTAKMIFPVAEIIAH
ncbi:MAG: fumarylacetoacetate hydrolase family protein, partial [Pseudomonadota bacterium]